MQDCSLFRILGIYEASSRFKKHVKLKELYGHWSYMFDSGKSYIIQLQFYLAADKAHLPKTLATHVSTQSIHLSKPLIKNVGLSTEAEIIVNVNKVYSTEIATLVIEDGTDKEIQMSRAEFVVVVRPERWLPLVILLIAVGTFLTSVSADMVKDIASLLNAGPWMSNDATLIAYMLKGLGSALVALGAYLGFRKMPYH